jgi:cytochrome-b5 reductase
MGGPLLHADIEDMASFGPAIVCPWHRYQISLRSGDGLYVNMSRQTCSKGLRQRTHAVERRDGQIFITVPHAPSAASEDKVESDTYAFKPPAPSGGTHNQPPPGRSGQVLRSGAAGIRGAGCAGTRASGGCGPLAPGVASDVAKSMQGADGRAPWAGGPAVGGAAGALPPTKKGAPRSFGFKMPSWTGLDAGAKKADPASGWSTGVVVASRPVGRSTVQLTVRGALPGGDASVWERGAHLMVSLPGHAIERPYTPLVLDGAPGVFELLVKGYPQGQLSPLLANLRPRSELQYKGSLSGSAGVRPNTRHLSLIAGGTGITPLLQLLLPLARRAREGGAALPLVRLLCFNRAEGDILLREQLDELAAAHPSVAVAHCLTEPPEGWSGLGGRPSAQIFSQALPAAGADAQVFYCGPPPFNDAVRVALGDVGFTEDMVHEFS